MTFNDVADLFCPWRKTRWPLLLLALMGLYACAPQVTRDCAAECPSAAAVEQARQEAEAARSKAVEIEGLEAAIGRQRQQIMRLELSLLAKQSEIQALASAEREAVQEVVRTKAKLRSLNSKAETVANLAEIKLSLQGLSTEERGSVGPERLAQAQQYIGMSEAALEEGNIDGAAYLIGQAGAYLVTAEMPAGAGTATDDELRRFHVPVSMTLKRTANVRSGAGTDSDVLTTLSAGGPVTAIGYAGLWVRIVLEDETMGWVHYGLLENPL